ncbi:Phosphotransferase system enzyme IIA component [Nostocoides japonicum T1-X7]|uniref:Phosphotransferase system enzyme IIA component n=1 Tax=Nostocoides japonicum T1-X7 TaxID=1194083 RepID=A0A077M6T2_9MICO|nr:Phosphotransferase system enzyme IIA component [Tetrasphaera japonica T1-X7]
MTVLAPCPGRVLPLSACSDPVFSGEMVGPGLLIDPDPGETEVVSPIAGTVAKVHPHAFVVAGSDGVAVLVHLGINTVKLDGAGFTVLAEQGSTVEAGAPMVRWDPSAITADGMTSEVPVVLLDRPAGSVPAPAEGSTVTTGDPLVTVDA